MKETYYMLAQTNSTPDEHICSLATYMHVHMHAHAPVLAHHYYPMHTLQYVQYDHSVCNHTITHHTFPPAEAASVKTCRPKGAVDSDPTPASSSSLAFVITAFMRIMYTVS